MAADPSMPSALTRNTESSLARPATSPSAGFATPSERLTNTAYIPIESPLICWMTPASWATMNFLGRIATYPAGNRVGLSRQ